MIVAGFFLRTYHAVGEMQGDEKFSCMMLTQDFAGIIRTTFTLQEPHPVGYYFLSKVWLFFSGYTEFAQRMLSIGMGTISIALIVRLTRALLPGRYGRRVSLAAAAFMAANSLALEQSRELRMYAMLLALGMAGTVLMLEMLRQPRRRTWLAYVLITWLAVQIHYYALFVILAQNIYIACLLLRASPHARRSLFRRWASAQLAVIALAAPWLYLVRGILLTYHGWGSMPSPEEAIRSVLTWFSVGAHLTGQTLLFAVLGGLAALLGLYKLWLAGPAQRRAALLLLIYAAVPTACIWLLSLSRPVFMDRYLISSLAPFQILLAAGIIPLSSNAGTSRQQKLTIAQAAIGVMLAGTLGFGLASSSIGYLAQQTGRWPNSFTYLRDTFVQLSGNLPANQVRWAVSYPDYSFSCYLHTPDYAVIPYEANNKEAADQTVQAFSAAGVRRVVIAIATDAWWNGQTIAPQALAKEYTEVGETFSGQWPLKIYSRMDASELTKSDATFSEGLTLNGYAIYADPQAHLLEVHLAWQGDAQFLQGDEKLFIHVASPNTPDLLVTQLDTPFMTTDLAGGVRTFGVALPDTIPSGDYTVTIGLYHGSRAGMPRLLTGQGDDRVEIGHFALKHNE
jgi:hypothetical protein